MHLNGISLESDTPKKIYKDAISKAARHDWFFRCSIACFLVGCFTFGITIISVIHQGPVWPFVMLQRWTS